MQVVIASVAAGLFAFKNQVRVFFRSVFGGKKKDADPPQDGDQG